MDVALLLVALVVVTALAFDFTNGFHDTGNAMATSIATGALKPKTAVALSAILNLIGAFLSVEVALTVTNAVIKIQDKSGAPKTEYLANHGEALLMIVLCGLVGGIIWNLLTWLLGLPSSSSHALFGGMIGATAAGIGWHGVNWAGDGSKLDGVLGKVVMPALVSLAHGTNDAQKTMGVITLALIAYGSWTDTHSIPLWVKVACAAAIALGTYLGGWRIIRTLGKGLVEISSPQGMAAESASAAVILTSSHLGFALSTTHVATGSILGTGLGRPGAEVRWGVAGRMVAAWLITLPAAGIVGALTWFVGHLIGGIVGALVVFGVLLALSTYMWMRSRRAPVDHNNVNAEWDGGVAPADAGRPTPATTGAHSATSRTGQEV